MWIALLAKETQADTTGLHLGSPYVEGALVLQHWAQIPVLLCDCDQLAQTL